MAIDFNHYKAITPITPTTDRFGNFLASAYRSSLKNSIYIDADRFDVVYAKGNRYLFINKKCFYTYQYSKPRINYVDLSLLPEALRHKLLNFLKIGYEERNVLYTENPFLANLEVCEFETKQTLKKLKDRAQIKKAVKQLNIIDGFRGYINPIEPTRLQHLIHMNRENQFIRSVPINTVYMSADYAGFISGEQLIANND